MRTPDFVIVGAAKSGTTSLSNYLDGHPQITVVSNRLEFFGEYENPAFSRMRLDDYLDLFQDCPDEVVAGEKSVSYLYSEKAAEEIAEVCPNAKILMVLRDPVERAYSDYWHRRRRGVESLSFEEALRREADRIEAGARFELHYATYGLYAEKVERYFRLFGKDSVKVFLLEDLKESPERVCRECFDFLGVETEFVPDGFQVYNEGAQRADSPVLMLLHWMARNSVIVSVVRALVPDEVRSRVTDWMQRKERGAGDYPEMDTETREELRSFFREDIMRLEQLLNRDLDAWLSEHEELQGTNM